MEQAVAAGPSLGQGPLAQQAPETPKKEGPRVPSLPHDLQEAAASAGLAGHTFPFNK